jgi:hypothetical protein
VEQSLSLLHQPQLSLPEIQQNENHFSTNGKLSKYELPQPRGAPQPNVKSEFLPTGRKPLKTRLRNFRQLCRLFPPKSYTGLWCRIPGPAAASGPPVWMLPHPFSAATEKG